MKFAKLIILLLFTPLLVFGRNVYDVKKLSEKEMVQLYGRVLVDAYRHSDQVWKTASFDSSAGYWGDGVSDGNQGIRAVGEMIFVSGTLLKYCDDAKAFRRDECLTKAKAALRYVTSTHVTGKQKCPDGKSWGHSWQSAMWTGTFAFGAWLIWNDLDPALRSDVERVIASEADRFLAGKPPGGTVSDTKAEENGWNLICISIAANMFPKHPHAQTWNTKAIEYMMNTLSAPQDANDTTIVDGRPVRDWFAGANIHPDFTLENHGFFHPAYVACSSYFLTQTAMHFNYAQRPVPQAAKHHLRNVWKMFRRIILPYGEPAYPQGMDWEVHGITLINLFASLAALENDPIAADWEQSTLQYMRRWQEMEKGSMATPGSRLGFTRHAICAEQVAYGLLAHKIFGPAKPRDAAKATRSLNGVWTSDSVALVTHRTDEKLLSFSWKNRIGGTITPLGDGHAGSPFFTAPIPNGLIGTFDLDPVGDKRLKVVERSWTETSNGCETKGTLLLNGGRLEQKVLVTSIGKHTVVYQDRIVALSNVTVTAEFGLPLGIENDEVSGGERRVNDQTGEHLFTWEKPQAWQSLSGPWANVAGRLGVVSVISSGLNYTQASGYHPGMGICADILYGSFSNVPRSVKPGEQVAQRIFVIFTEIDARKTAALANEIKLNGTALTVRLPEGAKAEITVR